MSIALAMGLTLAMQIAPSAADLADGKCVAAMITLEEQLKDEKQKAGVNSAMMFYMGKIVGRSGAGAVKATLEAAAALVDAAALTQLAESCAADVEKSVAGL
jgi:hypothetical protein